MGVSLWVAEVYDPIDKTKLLGKVTAFQRRSLLLKINAVLTDHDYPVQLTEYYLSCLANLDKKHNKKVDDVSQWVKVRRVI